MGRSLAGKPPAGANLAPSDGASRRGSSSIRSSNDGIRGPDTARSSISNSVPMRPNSHHAMWGKPGAMTPKETGQAIILNYSYVAGSFGVISILAGAVLQGDKNINKKFLGSGPGVYFILRGVTSIITTLVGCVLRGYWALSDFQGSGKLKSYAIMLAADWVWGLLVILAAGLCMHDSFFWWVGIVSDSVFQLGVLRTLTDLISMAMRHKKFKRDESKNNAGEYRGEVDSSSLSPRRADSFTSSAGGVLVGEQHERNESKLRSYDTEMGDAISVPTSPNLQEVVPSAPPLEPTFITTVIADEIDGVPTAPSSPMIQISVPAAAASPMLTQHDFEEKWLRLRQLSSTSRSCRVVPSVADVKIHLTDRGFKVIASGVVEGLTRVFSYLPLEYGSFLLLELLLAPGVDARAPCTCTLTIKVDGSEGSPSIGRAVDSLDLKMLLHN